VLPNLSQVNLHDSGSSHYGSTGQIGNDELMTDDESAADMSAICDSKIYEFSDPLKQRQCLPRMAHYKSMNPDEVMFLEAACALSGVVCDVGHKKDLKFDQNFAMTSRPSNAEVGLGSALSIVKVRSNRKETSTSKKRQPLGPPPFTLPKIRKIASPK
jgi:hypothetical protein